MNFLKKLAVDIMTPSDIIFSFHLPTLLSDFRNKIEKLFWDLCLFTWSRISNHSLSSLIAWNLKNSTNEPGKKTAASANANPAGNWIQLIKATTVIENRSDCYDLTGKSILCVGGRSMFYPAYRHLVEKSGASMLCFRGDPDGNISHLYVLLESADMVICPVDCVNHQAYFAVKYYCQRTCKPCVLLDRSRVPSFQKGIEKLMGVVTR